MSGVSITIDTAALGRLLEAAVDGIEDCAHAAIEASDRVVPIEEGTLSRSGHVSVDRQARVAQASYDTPYAVVQHEDPTLVHDEGRKAKYLEDVVVGDIAPAAAEIVARRVRAVR